ncbi:YggT family protein [Campylobacter hepaticus]|uniref:YggT family protein n=1 Tax=Campylobacter hepaticus TaxID=1813019 RepID=A0A424Z2K8_9BACT|nr:YggT family protein [Campylobacter hepaticus]AXP08611.1 YggT family protein [Campylobacter hepaticus]MCZ0772454.1 YggT family protein [Campylobacter hepaticus]MCZ0773922.1 YggT family protein [Campylobacter hepaticus]MCZ0775173.1 YggT family protein [Campylobacter hepaticus]MDX2323324.1 YggT family protein [Campylobacter hepaticus]
MFFDSFIISIFQIVQIIINIYIWIIIITALLSWVNPDPYNPIVQILYKLSYPAYNLVRKIPTRIGSIDLAPLIIVLILKFLDIFLQNILKGIL